MRKQVLDIEHTADIVGIALIDRDAAVVVLHDAVDHGREVVFYTQVDDVLPGGHNLLGRLVAEADDALEHALLHLDVLLVGEFERLLQVVDTQHVRLLVHHLARQCAAAHQHRLNRPEEPPEQHDAPRRETAISERVLPRIDLGHDFAEEQQEEGEDDGDAEKLEPQCLAEVHHIRKDIVAEHDDGDVDQVVGDKDCSQRALTLFPESLDITVGGIVVRVERVEVRGRETEESDLGGTGIAREKQQNDSERCRQPYAQSGRQQVDIAQGLLKIVDCIQNASVLHQKGRSASEGMSPPPSGLS